jgi:hypothetical protein
MTSVWFALLGLVLGAFGTLIGVGGGFLLVPILLILYPHENPAVLTSISLAIVCINAVSGSVAYGRMGRVDIKSGALFAAAMVPGAILGALTTPLIPRVVFDRLLGVVVLLGGAYLLVKPVRDPNARQRWPDGWHRVITERSGAVHEYRYPRGLAIGLSVIIGFVSSVLGLGGGIMHVPLLVNLFDFPVHVATATSHFTLAFMAGAGSAVHAVSGTLRPGLGRIVALSIGVVPGAQAGARLSSRVRGPGIIRALALALALVGIRLLIGVA